MKAQAFTDKPYPVDVVIAWVDGSEASLLEKRERYLDNKGEHKISSGAHSTRFASNNEIRYCVLSIIRFAPFVRNIFIVTDGQDPNLSSEIKASYPEWLNRIRIVDHSEIFEGFEKYLPTFNSISIGNMIWRIKGLSENFVYFNDDTFLIREIKPEDWFVENTPVLRGRWVAVPLLRIMWNGIRIFLNRNLMGKKDYQPRASFHMGQWASASLLGFRFRYFTNSHTPHTVEKKIVQDFFSINTAKFEKNISFRFRSYTQFTFISLSNHLQLLGGNRLIGKPDLAYLQPFNRPNDYLDKKISYCEKNMNIKFLCVQSLDLCSSNDQNKILDWLENRFRK